MPKSKTFCSFCSWRAHVLIDRLISELMNNRNDEGANRGFGDNSAVIPPLPGHRNGSGRFATLAVPPRASSRVSNLAADRRGLSCVQRTAPGLLI
jgi:hypothetical protein